MDPLPILMAGDLGSMIDNRLGSPKKEDRDRVSHDASLADTKRSRQRDEKVEKRVYNALHDFDAQSDNELTLRKYDIVEVLDKRSGGKYPSSFFFLNPYSAR